MTSTYPSVARQNEDQGGGPDSGRSGGARAGLRAAGVGVLAGVAGVAAMTVSEKLEQQRTGRANSYVPSQTLRRLAGARARTGRRHHDASDLATNHAMHWGQGALLGAVRGVMAQSGHRGLGASLPFTGIRLTADQTLENLTGVGSPPWTWPRGELAADVWHKFVYAVVTGLVCDHLVPATTSDRDR